MNGWTARALAEHTDTPPTTLSTWISDGLVAVEEAGVGRTGHTIGVMGLLELLAVKQLRGAGFSLQAIRKTVDNLRALSGEDRPLARLTLVVHGDDIIWRDAGDIDGVTVSAFRRPGQRLMVFPLGEAHADLVEQLSSEVSGEPGADRSPDGARRAASGPAAREADRGAQREFAQPPS